MVDCRFEDFFHRPAINYQVYDEEHQCKEITIRDCTFINCRQSIKFEHATESDGSDHGDDIYVDPGQVEPTDYNLWIRNCRFDITGEVQSDGAFSLFTPMAVWIEAEGIYNVLLDNCFIEGTGNALPAPDSTNAESNFRNGVVVDLMYDPTLCKVNLATRNLNPAPQPPIPGYIEDVYDNGILIMTSDEAKIVTKLNSGKFPYLNDRGLRELDIHGCMTGSGIKVEGRAVQTQSRIMVYDSELHENGQAGIDITAYEGSDLDLEVANNSIHDNDNGGIRVEALAGRCEIDMANNDIYDSDPAGSQGYAGVYLRTRTPPLLPETPSILEAVLERNRIHHLEGDGLRILAEDQWLLTNLLQVTSANDRIHHNESHGVFITGIYDLYLCMDVDFSWLTSCDNEGMGIAFSVDSDHLTVDVVNSIFWGNMIDGDVDPSFKGTISYSDWDGGLNGGGGGINYPNSINSDPLFSDAHFHLKWIQGDPFNQSPCVDKGNDNYTILVQQDMEGDARKIDVAPNTTNDTDMGADEHDPN